MWGGAETVDPGRTGGNGITAGGGGRGVSLADWILPPSWLVLVTGGGGPTGSTGRGSDLAVDLIRFCICGGSRRS